MSISVRGVNLGYMNFDMSLLVNRPDNVGSTYHCPVIAYIVETPDGRILWETGLSVACAEEWRPEWTELVDMGEVTPQVCLERRLGELGLGPEDFRYVVQGHLHSDHAGGLRLFETADAEVVVHDAEYAHVMSLEEDRDFYVRADWAFLADRLPTLVSGDTTELTRGVRLHHFPGHTPGQVAMQVDLEHTGTVLLASDAIYHHETCIPPTGETQVYWDIDRWRTSRDAVIELAKRTDALLFPGHDEQAIRYVAGQSRLEDIPFTPGHSYA